MLVSPSTGYTPARTQNVQFQGFIRDKFKERYGNRDAAIKVTKQVLDKAAKRRQIWGRVSDYVDLVPVVGDLISGAHGTAYVIKGYKEGLPKKELAKMAGWVAVDVGFGVGVSTLSWSPPGWVLKGADMLILRSGKRVIGIYEKASAAKALEGTATELGMVELQEVSKPDLKGKPAIEQKAAERDVQSEIDDLLK